MAAFCLIVGVYFLQPGFGGLDDLTLSSIGRVIQWLPSYWFLATVPAIERIACIRRWRRWRGGRGWDWRSWCAVRP